MRMSRGVHFNMMRFLSIILVGLSLSLAGCVHRGPIAASPDVELTNLNTLPSPTIEPYVIGGQQQLDITVANAEMLSGKYLTDSQGRVDFPLIGEVDANGMTPNQFAAVLERHLSGRYLVNPQVRVMPTTLSPPSIAVGGQVSNPGTFQANQSPTLLRAVYNAGGLADYADTKEVLVQRVVDGRHYIGVYNLTAIERGNYGDPAIYPGDIISVGDSPQRRTLDRILQTVPILTSVAVLVTRF